MRDGGTLTIDTENVVADEVYGMGRPGLEPGRYVRVRVTDTGTGMSPSALEHAFEPFFTTKPKGQGTGLGLATVYGIVSQAGGNVTIYSEVGIGTRVSVLLPATSIVPAAPEPKEARPQEKASGAVLVVEDAEDLREVIDRILTRNGYSVISAANGPEAIEAVRQHQGQIDLLITDVVMPLMQGKEVAKRILAMRPNVRVLYISGYAQPMLGATGTLDEGVLLLEKPFTESTLMAKVKQALATPGR
jgi:CheY-like chemotaxis protein